MFLLYYPPFFPWCVLVVDVEHERPHLDALSRFLIHVPLVYETTMWRSPGAPSTFVTVEAPEHEHFLRALLV